MAKKFRDVKLSDAAVSAVCGIAPDSNGSVPLPSVFYTEQALSDDEKEQARKNIGAMSSETSIPVLDTEMPKTEPTEDGQGLTKHGIWSWVKESLAIPFASLPADNTTSSYKRFRVTVTDDMTIVLHTPTSGDAEIFECRFDGSGLVADKSISFSTSGATAKTMDMDCGTVKAGKIALMSAFWNGTSWDVNWKVEG